MKSLLLSLLLLFLQLHGTRSCLPEGKSDKLRIGDTAYVCIFIGPLSWNTTGKYIKVATTVEADKFSKVKVPRAWTSTDYYNDSLIMQFYNQDTVFTPSNFGIGVSVSAMGVLSNHRIYRQLLNFSVEYPTISPTALPSALPTRVPSLVPTRNTTDIPTISPSEVPTDVPTETPTSSSPSLAPSNLPTFLPSQTPSLPPSIEPTTSLPSVNPTISPTLDPTKTPTLAPSSPPTLLPTPSPTTEPTFIPSSSPVISPTVVPSLLPSTIPTESPAATHQTLQAMQHSEEMAILADTNTSRPTLLPSIAPTTLSTVAVSARPSGRPTFAPTSLPTTTMQHYAITFPLLVLLIEVDHGKVTSVTWDNACNWCSSTDCQQNTITYNSRDIYTNDGPNCFVHDADCLSAGSSQRHQHVNDLCALTVYVSWHGTDITGTSFTSAAQRFSRWSSTQMKDFIDTLK